MARAPAAKVESAEDIKKALLQESCAGPSATGLVAKKRGLAHRDPQSYLSSK
jgi:hypothetical protein